MLKVLYTHIIFVQDVFLSFTIEKDEEHTNFMFREHKPFKEYNTQIQKFNKWQRL